MIRLVSKKQVIAIVIINYLIALAVLVGIVLFILPPLFEVFRASSTISCCIFFLVSFGLTAYAIMTTKYINNQYVMDYDDEFFMAFDDDFGDWLLKFILFSGAGLGMILLWI